MLRHIPAALTALIFATSAYAQDIDLAISNISVIDVEDGVVLPGQTILIDDGKIVAVGLSDEYSEVAEENIDGTGKFVIPGLIDMHVHTNRDGLPLLLEHGVTTIRDMGTHFAPLAPNSGGQLAMRAEIAAGTLAGPEMFLALRILDGDIPRNPRWAMHYASVTSAEEGRTLVDQVADAGGDLVKVYTDLTPDVFNAIAQRATERGLKFAGHVPGQVGYRKAAEAGIHTVEHLRGIFIDLSSEEEIWRAGFTEAASQQDAFASYQFTNANIPAMAESYDEEKAAALFDILRQNQVGVVPTLVVLDDPRWRYPSARPDPEIVERLDPIYRNIVSATGDAASPHASIRDAELSFDLRVKLVGDMHKAGVDILVGTDYANPFVLPGISMHEELSQLVRAGLSPAEAIRAATLVNARYLDAEDRLGSIEPGKEADLVILGANPLRDIAASRTIETVIVNGQIYQSAE